MIAAGKPKSLRPVEVHAVTADDTGKAVLVVSALAKPESAPGVPAVLSKDVILDLLQQALAHRVLDVNDVTGAARTAVMAHREALRALQDEARAERMLRLGSDAGAWRAALYGAKVRLRFFPNEVRNILGLLRTADNDAICVERLSEQQMETQLGLSSATDSLLSLTSSRASGSAPQDNPITSVASSFSLPPAH